MQVARWGNSLAVRLPTVLVKELGLKEGDRIELQPGPGRGSGARLEVVRERSREEIVEDIFKRSQGSMDADFKFDREEANAR